MEFDGLPGGDLVASGLADAAAGRETVPALLVSIGASRLRGLGIEVVGAVGGAEHLLWALLAAQDPDTAHGRYNALVRQLVSFERALECAG